jgi:aryl-alcohol dehydrogenase-like predicted oxidoreductase
VLHSPAIAEVAHAFSATPAQIVFSFARAVGIVPLTGTASLEHMQQDLASSSVALPADLIEAVEKLAR